MRERSRSLGAVTLRRWRASQGLTQPEVAAMCGADFVQISKFERGASKPARTTAVRIAAATGGAVSVESWDLAERRPGGRSASQGGR